MTNINSGIKSILLSSMLSLATALNCAAQSYDKANAAVKNEFRWPEGKQVAISLTFDDARLTQPDKGIPLLDKYGIKGTFYISPDNVTPRLEAWKKAAAGGHEIGNHSVVHPCTGNFDWSRDKALEDYTLEKMAAELDSANRFIKKFIEVDAISFAYPCGQTFVGRGTNLKSYIPLVASMFESGRGWLDEGPNDPVYCDFAQLTGIELDGKSFDQVKAVIESARKTGKWIVFAGHEINDSGKQTTLMSTLEELCKYASDPANGVWIDNVHNIAAYVRSQRNLQPFTVLPVYKNPVFSDEQRIKDLISRMTLEEKVGQMNMPCAYVEGLGKDRKSKLEGIRKFAEGTQVKGLGPGGGFFTVPNNVLPEGPRQQAEFHNELQKIALTETRLGIPLLMTEEGTHGYMASGATIFPEGPGIGSTWNMDLVKDIYTVTAREARAAGIHQVFTLVVEPNRDPRLGRNEEGYSEDPFLCSQIAESIVKGAQGENVAAPDKVVAGLCHYPGQSQPAGGLEWGAMNISERMLREVFLPPWVAGIKKSGALGVMATYPSIDDVPVHASEKLLTGILRQELGFEGLVLSEGEGFNTMINERVAANQKDAGALSIKAGVDVGITYEDAYMLPLIENVNEGKVGMVNIDRAVKRILMQKLRLGLFENPFVDPEKAVKVSRTQENQDLALKVAQEGMVLLKNEKNLLPLKKNLKSIAVIGPNADADRNQLGDYTSRTILQEIITPLKGIKAEVNPSTKVTYVKGCNVMGNELNEIKKARDAARNSDVAIVVVGENDRRGTFGKPGDGEGLDVASLDLTGMQEDLVKAVAATGTPVIVVLINGRPLSIRWIAENVAAVIEAWNCGEKGGAALADIIFGDVNPSGKLPVTIPRHVGQLPSYYNYTGHKAARKQQGYVDMPISPLYEFGYGLSYTTFEYSNLKITPGTNGVQGDFMVSLDVKNTGKRQGAEVVQLYINDNVSSVTRPVKELKGFRKICLGPGESGKVEFTITPGDLALLDQNMKWIVEPGKFSVMIGSSSEDIRLRGEIEVR